MGSTKRLQNAAGWLVFAITLIVYYFSAERTGSLWDCGEFILGAYKLQVVHPPGAPLFVLVGRLFTWVAELFSSDPAMIAFSVNLMSSICTAFAATFICWVTIMLSKIMLVGREGEMDQGQIIATAGAGVVAGLSTAFCTSVWFSAVEGEVYAMSTFFTTMTLWSMIKWYSLPDTAKADRWLLFTVYSAGLSIGVHLLSILTFPALALFYYFKKYKEHTFIGMGIAAAAGVAAIVAIQNLVIVGIPTMWSGFDLFMVNSLGFGFHTGLIPTFLMIGALIFFGLRYAKQKNLPLLQNVIVGFTLVIIGFSTIGVVVIRANAAPPVNMNAPTDVMRLLPYINREQYGERALLRGPHFEASPERTTTSDRYGRVGDSYEVVDHKIDVIYSDKDKMAFPRVGDSSQGRPRLYKMWLGLDPNKPLPAGRPNFADNISFLVQYQLGWMYWRYFMWNFSGRQNGEQGYYSWDKSSGNWITGVGFIDSMRLGNQSELTETMLNDQGRNAYFAIPFIFGLIGLFFHFRGSYNEAMGLLALFIITGIGIIIYSNQPPNEPRERDYVLVGSFFTYSIWIGMAVVALFQLLRDKIGQSGPVSAAIATAIILTAPVLMGTQNFDDHSRIDHSGARDYAANFLESCEPNAIIFTYGDNDTYPLWYAQEVEGIRTDVRVVNLSLIAVDWYIDLLRRKVNDSDPIKMTIPREAYRGKKRNQVFFYDGGRGRNPAVSIQQFMKFIGDYNPLQTGTGRELESHYQSTNVYIPVDYNKAIESGALTSADTNYVQRIPVKIPQDYMTKDEIAILDIIASNLWERPVYFAVTCRQEKLFGLQDYMQLEGLSLRITPVKSKSDDLYGLVGNGRVNTEAVYNNVMNKYKWGGFDEHELFVDRSYAPSVQSHQLAIRRTAFELIREGEPEKAVEMIDKYFEAFPHMNFAYDYRAYTMIGVYLQAGQYDKAKPHLEILADEIRDRMEFYTSLDQETLSLSYNDEYRFTDQIMESMVGDAQRSKDDEFVKRLEELFKPYRQTAGRDIDIR